MDNNWASEHLQVIRTLMERSALYRRALAPIMTFAGAIGTIAAGIGWLLEIESERGFGGYWFAVGAVGLTGSLLLVRRQALKASEQFWSPPTLRVAVAALPAGVAGVLMGVMNAVYGLPSLSLAFLLAVFYGLALHSAGFFTLRGLRLLGWLFLGVSLPLLVVSPAIIGAMPAVKNPGSQWAHLSMGAMFGLLQLAYGIYLYFTERPAAQP
jgi:hypothetical protein